MEAALTALEASALAEALRFSRWGYAAVNAGHILGIALLVGALVPLDLRLMGLWPSVPAPLLARVLMPVAAAGLGLAVLCGALLFSAGATDYAGEPVFLAKLALVALGAGSALYAYRRAGPALERWSPARRRLQAALSLACWLPALALGRAIAFVM
jgi:hypothetical protein